MTYRLGWSSDTTVEPEGPHPPISSSPRPACAVASPAEPSVDQPRSSLMEVLKTLPDPRQRRGQRHGLAAVLAVGLAAVIAGAKSFVAIAEWVAHQPLEVLALRVNMRDAARCVIRRRKGLPPLGTATLLG